MPQWAADRDEIAARHPDERWTAACPAAEAALLLKYDHHVIWLDGRRALLLTQPWAERDPAMPLRCEASFRFADGHPQSPSDVQTVVASLQWEKP